MFAFDDIEYVKHLFESLDPIKQYDQNNKKDKTTNETYMLHGQKVWRNGHREMTAVWMKDRNQYNVEGTNEYIDTLTGVDKYVIKELKLDIKPSKNAFGRFSTEVNGKEMNLKHYINTKKKEEIGLKEESDDESYESEDSGCS